jgi:hypothetical protein
MDGMDDLLLVDDYLLPLPRSCHQLCRRLHRQPAYGAERILVQRGSPGETTLRDSTITAFTLLCMQGLGLRHQHQDLQPVNPNPLRVGR